MVLRICFMLIYHRTHHIAVKLPGIATTLWLLLLPAARKRLDIAKLARSISRETIYRVIEVDFGKLS